MVVEISKHDELYYADCLDLPGSPKLGIAISEEGAIIDLLMHIVRDGNTHLDFSGIEVIKPD